MSVTIHKPPRKIDNEYDWIASPEGDTKDGTSERALVDRRGEILVYAEIADDNSSYDFDNFALIRLGRAWYLLNTSGCSCPDPAENWNIQIGPVRLKDIRAFLRDGHYDGYTVPAKQLNQFLDALDSAEGLR